MLFRKSNSRELEFNSYSGSVNFYHEQSGSQRNSDQIYSSEPKQIQVKSEKSLEFEYRSQGTSFSEIPSEEMHKSNIDETILHSASRSMNKASAVN